MMLGCRGQFGLPSYRPMTSVVRGNIMFPQRRLGRGGCSLSWPSFGADMSIGVSAPFAHVRTGVEAVRSCHVG